MLASTVGTHSYIFLLQTQLHIGHVVSKCVKQSENITAVPMTEATGHRLWLLCMHGMISIGRLACRSVRLQ